MQKEFVKNQVHLYCFHKKDQQQPINQIHLIKWSSVSMTTSINAAVLVVRWSGAFMCVLTQRQGGNQQWS